MRGTPGLVWALTIAHRHPYEVDEDWWAVVDAVLAPAVG